MSRRDDLERRAALGPPPRRCACGYDAIHGTDYCSQCLPAQAPCVTVTPDTEEVLALRMTIQRAEKALAELRAELRRKTAWHP